MTDQQSGRPLTSGDGRPGFGRSLTEPTDADLAALTVELGRPPRGVRAVAYRCRHGVPAVVQTLPVLPDGTPFPTLYYLSCSALNATVGRMEAEGLMAELTARLADEPELAAGYRRAHELYLAERDALHHLGIDTTAGGMPTRIKCLHALLAHSLAVGPGVNPVGDIAAARLSDFTRSGRPCAGPDR